MVAHSTLTGADLHEPKGASAASANTVYVFDGAGSGTAQKIAAGQIDASIKNVNKYKLLVELSPLNSTSTEAFVVFPEACTVTKITSVLAGAISGTDAVVTFTKNSVDSLGTITVANASSAEGDVDSLTPVANNTFTANQYMKLAVTTATTGAIPLYLVIDITLT